MSDRQSTQAMEGVKEQSAEPVVVILSDDDDDEDDVILVREEKAGSDDDVVVVAVEPAVQQKGATANPQGISNNTVSQIDGQNSEDSSDLTSALEFVLHSLLNEEDLSGKNNASLSNQPTELSASSSGITNSVSDRSFSSFSNKDSTSSNDLLPTAINLPVSLQQQPGIGKIESDLIQATPSVISPAVLLNDPLRCEHGLSFMITPNSSAGGSNICSSAETTAGVVKCEKTFYVNSNVGLPKNICLSSSSQSSRVSSGGVQMAVSSLSPPVSSCTLSSASNCRNNLSNNNPPLQGIILPGAQIQSHVAAAETQDDLSKKRGHDFVDFQAGKKMCIESLPSSSSSSSVSSFLDLNSMGGSTTSNCNTFLYEPGLVSSSFSQAGISLVNSKPTVQQSSLPVNAFLQSNAVYMPCQPEVGFRSVHNQIQVSQQSSNISAVLNQIDCLSKIRENRSNNGFVPYHRTLSECPPRQSSIGFQRSCSETAMHGQCMASSMSSGETVDLVQCSGCAKSVNESKMSKCDAGHWSCTACLQPQVKTVLTGDRMQKHIKCPTCNNSVHFDELKKALPSLVVDVLEEKLDKEYLSYINTWLFKDEGNLKSRLEFASSNSKSSPPRSNSGETRMMELFSGMSEGFPPLWAPMEEGAPVTVYEVDPDSEDYGFVLTMCLAEHGKQFMPCDIVRILRIQNPILWNYFKLKRNEMMLENGGEPVKERWLFHGTHRSSVESIARKGFDWRFTGKNGDLYGQGSYFAVDSNYSHGYTDSGGSGISMNKVRRRLGLAGSAFNHVIPRTLSFFGPAPAHTHHPIPPPAHGLLSSLQMTAHQGSSRGSGVQGSVWSVRTFLNIASNGQKPQAGGSVSSGSCHGAHDLTLSSGAGGLSATPQDLTVDRVEPQTAGSSSSVPQGAKKSLGSSDLQKVFLRDCSSTTHFMFFARVLVGKSVRGSSGLKRPPPIDGSQPYGKCFDSCVDRVENPSIYVIFDNNQAYPEYVLEYNTL